MKTVQHAFAFTEKSDWAWPDDDVKLLQVIDDVMGIDQIMRHVAISESHNDSHIYNTVVQAGGACGIWPYRLAQLFQQVVTFEPLSDNFRCLIGNCEGVCNVTAFQGILGSGDEPYRMAGMKQHPHEQNNAGSQQVELGVMGPDAMRVYTIDDLALNNVDAIILDLEGYEIFALSGAIETIDRCKPVICFEDKGLSEKFGYSQGWIEKWLAATFAYEVAERMKRDVIMVAR